MAGMRKLRMKAGPRIKMGFGGSKKGFGKQSFGYGKGK